jgi:hypothetical protein
MRKSKNKGERAAIGTVASTTLLWIVVVKENRGKVVATQPAWYLHSTSLDDNLQAAQVTVLTHRTQFEIIVNYVKLNIFNFHRSACTYFQRLNTSSSCLSFSESSWQYGYGINGVSFVILYCSG